jgi:hypothetical protein
MKKFVSGLCALGFVVASLGVVSAEFTDDSGQFYAPFVDYLSENKVVEGYDDGSFGYELTVNRAEMLKILIVGRFNPDQTEELAPWSEYAGESCFDDVPANKWYTEYICYAKAQEWIEGYDDNTYKPGQEVNFVEGMKILLKVFDIDYDEETDPWYKGLVETASEDNLIPLTVSSFDHKITRGEMSGMAAMALGIVDDCTGGDDDSDICKAYMNYFSNYVVTYEMVESGDSYFMNFEESAEEPGLSVNLSMEALVKSDCGGFKCFEEKFEACEASSLNVNIFLASINYEILGMEDGLCKVRTFEIRPQGDLMGKEMTCKLDNSQSFEVTQEEAMQEVVDTGASEVCEGAIVDWYASRVGEACEYEGSDYEHGMKMEVLDWGPNECVDGEWIECPDCFEKGDVCEYDGWVFSHGDSIRLNDCTTCVCVDGERKECTGVCE